MMHLETILVLFIYFFVVFIVGQIKNDNSLVDIAWGFGFVVAGVYSFIRGDSFGLRSLLVTGLITIWGLRLTYHIAIRNLGKPEDYRYVAMRRKWGTKWVRLKAFLNVYFLQFCVMAIVSLPVVHGNGNTQQQIGPLAVLGLTFWCIGFVFESLGDAQLKKFKSNPDNKGKLMTTGLWSLTRHPNYFGDAAMWFGIFFIAVTDYTGIWTIVGPALMAFFLRNVSGAKLLEKKYKGREDYEAYKKVTNMFFPWLPKKGAAS